MSDEKAVSTKGSGEDTNHHSVTVFGQQKTLLAMTDDLIDKGNKINQIATRAADPNSNTLFDLQTTNEALITELAEWMPVHNRKSYAFGRHNSQITDKGMSLSMISTNAFHSIKQCLAKIERKRGAVKETTIKLKKQRLQIELLQRIKERLLELQELVASGRDASDPRVAELLQYHKENMNFTEPGPEPGSTTETLPDEIRAQFGHLKDVDITLGLVDIELENLTSTMSDTALYYDGAMKEIKVYKDAYEEIMRNENIPEDWGEEEFLMADLEHHVKECFRHLIRDIMVHTRPGMGTMEYLEQFGIQPTLAVAYVKQYLQQQEHKLMGAPKFDTSSTVMHPDGRQGYDVMRDENGEVIWERPPQEPDINDLYTFLDQMLERFRDSYRDAWRRIGLDADGDIVNKDGIWKDKTFA